MEKWEPVRRNGEERKVLKKNQTGLIHEKKVGIQAVRPRKRRKLRRRRHNHASPAKALWAREPGLPGQAADH